MEGTGVTPEGHCGRKSPLLELGYLLSVQEPLWSSPSCAPSHSSPPGHFHSGSNCLQTPAVPPSRHAASHFHSPCISWQWRPVSIHRLRRHALMASCIHSLFYVVRTSASDGKGAGSPASVPSLLFVLQSRGRRCLVQLLLPGSLK